MNGIAIITTKDKKKHIGEINNTLELERISSALNHCKKFELRFNTIEHGEEEIKVADIEHVYVAYENDMDK